MTNDELKAINDIDTVSVDVPEWSTTIDLKALTVDDRCKLQAKFATLEATNTTIEIGVWYVIYSAVDGGKRRFTDADASWLKQKNTGIIDRLADKVRDISGLNEDAKKKTTQN